MCFSPNTLNGECKAPVVSLQFEPILNIAYDLNVKQIVAAPSPIFRCNILPGGGI